MSDVIPQTVQFEAEELALARKLRGRFIVLEGPDGSGKSTQYERLLALFDAAEAPACPVREPGGTPIGERVRDALLDRAVGQVSARCEMLLYMASRAELVETRIIPALRSGVTVLADRFTPSTMAYQGAAGGVPGMEIAAVAKAATRGLKPDVIVVFDVDEQTAASRLSPLLDRMEAKGAEFHRKVRRGYLQQAEQDPGRFLLVDARGGPDEVWRLLVEGLSDRVDRFGPRANER